MIELIIKALNELDIKAWTPTLTTSNEFADVYTVKTMDYVHKITIPKGEHIYNAKNTTGFNSAEGIAILKKLQNKIQFIQDTTHNEDENEILQIFTELNK